MLGASPRAAIHLMSATKANARLEGRDTVTIEDVRRWRTTCSRTASSCEDEDLTPEVALQMALDALATS